MTQSRQVIELDAVRYKDRQQLALQCFVSGCEAKLEDKKGSNRRFRLCREHLNNFDLKLGNKIFRHCQQCAKLHEIGAFNGNNRSCKEKLGARRGGRSQASTSISNACRNTVIQHDATTIQQATNASSSLNITAQNQDISRDVRAHDMSQPVQNKINSISGQYSCQDLGFAQTSCLPNVLHSQSPKAECSYPKWQPESQNTFNVQQFDKQQFPHTNMQYLVNDQHTKQLVDIGVPVQPDVENLPMLMQRDSQANSPQQNQGYITTSLPEGNIYIGIGNQNCQLDLNNRSPSEAYQQLNFQLKVQNRKEDTFGQLQTNLTPQQPNTTQEQYLYQLQKLPLPQANMSTSSSTSQGALNVVQVSNEQRQKLANFQTEICPQQQHSLAPQQQQLQQQQAPVTYVQDRVVQLLEAQLQRQDRNELAQQQKWQTADDIVQLQVQLNVNPNSQQSLQLLQRLNNMQQQNGC